ncbi:MAG: DUF4446 family protein [Chloroflexia bacterium]
MAFNEIATWGALGLSIVLLVLFMGHAARLRSLERRYSALLGRETSRYGAEGLPALGELVSGQGQRLDKTVNDLAGLSDVVTTMEKSVRGSVQHVGLVRFNPFQETGGDQSFALALLDGRGDGIVISSLHSRTVTRFYAKPVKGGTSQLSLSEEEAKAVQQAMGS